MGHTGSFSKAVSMYIHLSQQGGCSQVALSPKNPSWSLPLRQMFYEWQMNLHILSSHLANCCLCAHPGMSKAAHMPFKRSISDSHRPLGPMGINLVYFQSQTFCGPHLSSAGPKVWCASCGEQYSHSLGRSSGPVRSFPICGLLCWGGVLGKTLSLCIFYPSRCDPFIPCCGEGCSTNFQFFFGRIYSICSYKFGVVVGGGEFRIFLCCHFGPPPTPVGFDWNVKLSGLCTSKKKFISHT